MTLHNLTVAATGIPKNAIELLPRGPYWEAWPGEFRAVSVSELYLAGKTQVAEPERVFWDSDNMVLYVLADGKLHMGTPGPLTEAEELQGYVTLNALTYDELDDGDYDDEDEEGEGW